MPISAARPRNVRLCCSIIFFTLLLNIWILLGCEFYYCKPLTLNAEIYYLKAIDEIYYRNQGDFMSRKKQRLSPERKFKAVCEVIAGKQTCSEVARKYHISVSHLSGTCTHDQKPLFRRLSGGIRKRPPHYLRMKPGALLSSVIIGTWSESHRRFGR
jgi:hypothetical protein